jgi:hypothetical protein
MVKEHEQDRLVKFNQFAVLYCILSEMKWVIVVLGCHKFEPLSTCHCSLPEAARMAVAFILTGAVLCNI